MSETINLDTTAKLTQFCIKSLESSKALNIQDIDLNGNSSLTDVMLIASGTSSRHVSAIAERLEEHLHQVGFKNITLSGTNLGQWVIADCGFVMVHIMQEEVRERYQLENLYKVIATGADPIEYLEL